MPSDKDHATILVVDDNEMNRDMLARRLKRQNYTVHMADNGEDAIELMQSTAFDLVLLDIMMPKLNGYEVLERVKADSRLRNVPIIMISAVDDLDSVVRCIEMGAEDYLFKPFNPVLLKARVGASLDRSRRSPHGGNATGVKAALAAISDDLHELSSGKAGTFNEAQAQLLSNLTENIKLLADLLNH